MEITKGADGRHGIARLEVEHVAGTDTRGAVLSRGRGGDTDIEAEDRLLLRITGEGVVVAAVLPIGEFGPIASGPRPPGPR